TTGWESGAVNFSVTAEGVFSAFCTSAVVELALPGTATDVFISASGMFSGIALGLSSSDFVGDALVAIVNTRNPVRLAASASSPIQVERPSRAAEEVIPHTRP